MFFAFRLAGKRRACPALACPIQKRLAPAVFGVTLAVVVIAAFDNVAVAQEVPKRVSKMAAADPKMVERILALFPPRPRLAAVRIINKYGPPQEATAEKLVWHNNGPWKRTVVTRKEIRHDFPKLHMDYLEQTIAYRVPADMADQLIAFDGSVTIDRTAGEVSSRCNMEEANNLTLNLVHDMVTGAKNVEEAREAFGQNEVDFAMGRMPDYMAKLQFKLPQRTADPDKPVIAGSSKRATMDEDPAQGGSEQMDDAEILGMLVAINENEIEAASDVAKKDASREVVEFAQMLHEEHGKNLAATLKLGQSLDMTPLETRAVDQLRVEGAEHLAELVRLNGEDFDAAYVGQMVKGHRQTLDMVENQLLKDARSPELKQHLEKTREAIAAHLEEAEQLQGDREQ